MCIRYKRQRHHINPCHNAKIIICLILKSLRILRWSFYGSPANYRWQKTRIRSPLNSTAVLNLNCSLVFFFNSFFLYFFEKVPKTGQSCTAFGASFVQESLATSFSRCTPRRSLLVAMLGAARTRCAQTSCRLFPIIARLLAVPPNAALSLSATNYLLQ